MDAHYVDFLAILLRWMHVIAGIAWIGSSFYFMWLDYSLEPPAPDSENAKKGVAGELWAVHGGGFYNPQKYTVAPATLPPRLHWFKWEAYTTWLSGTALLVMIYWMRAATMMVEPRVARIEPWQAILYGAASLVGAWIVYDVLCRVLGKRDRLLGVLVFGLLTALAWGLGETLGGRAAFLHVGAAIGTIMAANVFFVIIPGQRRMVAAMRKGQPPHPEDGRRGKQRSVHNNYFTLPVVFTMIGSHAAMTYTHREAWAVLALIAAAGVSLRHFFNRRHRRAFAGHYLVLGAGLLALVAWWTKPRPLALPKIEKRVAFEEVRTIMTQRCMICHAPTPALPGYVYPPAGVVLHDPMSIVQNAPRVYQQVVVTRAMPPNNATQMTDYERAIVAEWVRSGAKM